MAKWAVRHRDCTTRCDGTTLPRRSPTLQQPEHGKGLWRDGVRICQGLALAGEPLHPRPELPHLVSPWPIPAACVMPYLCAMQQAPIRFPSPKQLSELSGEDWDSRVCARFPGPRSPDPRSFHEMMTITKELLPRAIAIHMATWPRIDIENQ
jgi:hypothetical protein